MNMALRLAVLFLLSAVLFCSGCAQSTVRLVYPPAPDTAAILPVGAAQVTVVHFADERGKLAVGARSDGSAFVPGGNVSDWFTQVFATELARQGVVVTLAPSEAKARAAGAHFIATGALQEIQLTEESATSYACVMRGSLLLRENATTLVKSGFSSSLARKVVPLSSVPQEMLSEAAGDLARSMAQAVAAKLGKTGGAKPQP